MKKIVFRLSVFILIILLLASSLLAGVLVYAKRNVDYNFDEELFSKAKIDSTVYYYAYNSKGDLKEVYKGTAGTKREWTGFSDVGEYFNLWRLYDNV